MTPDSNTTFYAVRCTDGLVHEESATLYCPARNPSKKDPRYFYKRPTPLTCLVCIACSGEWNP